MSISSIRERLVGCWRLVGYRVTTDGGEVRPPLGESPCGAILYTPDGYMSAQLTKPGPYADDQQPHAYAIAFSGPFEVNEQVGIVAHQVQVSAIPSWRGTIQIRQVQFPDPSTLVLTTSTTTITWSRQPPR
jgi:hypothetical protein